MSDNSSIAKGYSVPGMIMIAGATILLTLLLMALTNFGSGNAAAAASVSDRLTLPVILHLATVIPALPLGAYILLRRKGDRLHKILGRTWGGLMMTTAITSFWLGRSDGSGLFGTHLGFIHIFAVVTLVSIPLGVWQARIGNIKEHYRAMQGPYIGLIIAGIFSFIPDRILGNLVFG
ncbi:DUF2306 domain-containing protein [Sphingorhabdus sp. 109]|jgi:uncharacterized membrane protein|uniref:DUF2306 domain-containing protein n=1 Tax=Sphingorhabdus sp. 109 TaxID=2653173 RepID=UPI0012F36436|nr:DUF2306 domain-containing protein [Sphingorhabdus sp. 109]VWX60770.1 conserved membrane hypothetical protein [Sphingorhabdus sp. 109]